MSWDAALHTDDPARKSVAAHTTQTHSLQSSAANLSAVVNSRRGRVPPTLIWASEPAGEHEEAIRVTGRHAGSDTSRQMVLTCSVVAPPSSIGVRSCAPHINSGTISLFPGQRHQPIGTGEVGRKAESPGFSLFAMLDRWRSGRARQPLTGLPSSSPKAAGVHGR